MNFNPDIHHRRSIRLKNYDYSRNGAYFVTLCTFDRDCHFDQFPLLREIVDGQWRGLPARFPHVELDEYVVMPNHFHGIIVIHNGCRDTPSGYPFPSGYPDFNGYQAPCGHPGPEPGRAPARGAPTLGDVVGAFKSLSVNAWLKVIKTENINARGKFWQYNYYEHVIRNEEEMDRIRQYVVNNPLQWELDRENPLQGKQQQQPEKWMV